MQFEVCAAAKMGNSTTLRTLGKLKINENNHGRSLNNCRYICTYRAIRKIYFPFFTSSLTLFLKKGPDE